MTNKNFERVLLSNMTCLNAGCEKLPQGSCYHFQNIRAATYMPNEVTKSRRSSNARGAPREQRNVKDADSQPAGETIDRTKRFDLTRILAEIGRKGCKCDAIVTRQAICEIHALVFKANQIVDDMLARIVRAIGTTSLPNSDEPTEKECVCAEGCASCDALAEAFGAMREALRHMIKAHAELMPCIRYGSVPDYAIQNEAPIEARAALALASKVHGRNSCTRC